MQYDILQLVHFICTETLDSIHSKLTANACLLRNESLTKPILTSLKTQQVLLNFARIYINDNPAIPLDWRQSYTCFVDLHDWFLDTASLEKNEYYAVLCWLEHLQKYVPSRIEAEKIIILGMAFIGEHTKFAGFLCYLLHNNVTPREINDTGILHKYFSYHISNKDQLDATYALCKHLSLTKPFLNYAKNISCGQRAFINMQSNEGFSSFNVLGEIFEHAEEYAPNFYSFREKITDDLIALESDSGVIFKLFGFEFIKALNIKNIHHKKIIASLFVTDNQPLLVEFTRMALDGESDSDFVYDVFKLLYYKISVDEIKCIVEKNPFFVHIDKYKLSHTLLSESVAKMMIDEKFHTLHHVFLLVELYGNFPYYEGSDIFTDQIIGLIFKIILPYGDTLSDEIFDVLDTISDEIEVYLKSEFLQYYKKITEAVTQWRVGQIEYHEIEYVWGSQLSQINLIKHFLNDIIEDYNYPSSKYSLRAFSFKANKAKLKDINEIESLLRQMTQDPDDLKRTVQEILLNIQDIDILAGVISWILQHNLQETYLFNNGINGNKNILEHAISSDKLFFLGSVLAIIPITIEQRSSLLIYAGTQSIESFSALADSSELTNQLGIPILAIHQSYSLTTLMIENLLTELFNKTLFPLSLVTQYLLKHAEFKKINIDNYNDCFEKFATYNETVGMTILLENVSMLRKKTVQKVAWQLFNRININHIEHSLWNRMSLLLNADILIRPSINFISEVLKKAVEKNIIGIIKNICSMDGDRVLFKYCVKRAATRASQLRQWDMVKLLCGLSSETHINPKTIRKNNIHLYLQLLTAYGRQGLNHSNAMCSLLSITTANQETLLHLCVYSRSLTLLKNFFELIELNFDRQEIGALLKAKTSDDKIAQAFGNSNAAKTINDFLNDKRAQYAIEIQLRHYSRKRGRPVFFSFPDNISAHTTVNDRLSDISVSPH